MIKKLYYMNYLGNTDILNTLKTFYRRIFETFEFLKIYSILYLVTSETVLRGGSGPYNYNF